MMADHQIKEQEKKDRLLAETFEFEMMEREAGYVPSPDQLALMFGNEKEYVNDLKGRSEAAGDHYWRKAHAVSGHGDYIRGHDDGEWRELRYVH